MSVTKRFIALLAAGFVFLATAWSSGLSVQLFFVYNAVCFGLLLLDYLFSPKSSALALRRDDEDKLYYKTANTITIFARSLAPHTIYIELTDDLPDWHFTKLKSRLSGRIRPGEEAVFTYDVLATKRGLFHFTAVHVRLRGILGLCTKIFTFPLPMDYKVYPNLKDLSKYRLMIHKNRLLQDGVKRLAMKGAGTDFESLREYVEGDDIRKINWMNTARERKLIVNQYEAEKNQPIFMLIDTGRPMSYSLKGYKKLDYAINAALILSDIVNQKGDNSGLMVFDTDIQSVVMPGKGENHRKTLMETLYGVKDTKNTSDYEGAFLGLVNRQKRRSIVFIFTDFELLQEAKMLTDSIGILARRHIPVIVLMKNDSVMQTAKTDAHDLRSVYETAMAKEYLQERRKIIRTLNTRGILCVETDAEKFALATVNYYLSLKARHVV